MTATEISERRTTCEQAKNSRRREKLRERWAQREREREVDVPRRREDRLPKEREEQKRGFILETKKKNF